MVEALYHKHVRTVEQVGGIYADEFGVLNTAVHRLERFWIDAISAVMFFDSLLAILGGVTCFAQPGSMPASVPDPTGKGPRNSEVQPVSRLNMWAGPATELDTASQKLNTMLTPAE
jgi:hypothetical protein